MSGGIRIKLKDGVYISLIQVSTHEKNILGVEGIREKGSVEAVLISVDEDMEILRECLDKWCD